LGMRKSLKLGSPKEGTILAGMPWARGASSLRSTGKDYLHRNTLPLRPKRSLVIGFENEAASRTDGIGAEDALVVLACKHARLAAFSFDETNNCSAYACRPNGAERSCGSCRTGRSRVAFLAFLGQRLFFASRESPNSRRTMSQRTCMISPQVPNDP
jgi:hypothetical protein